MKAKSTVLVCFGLLACAFVSFAGDETKTTPPTPKDEQVILTGSYIKRDVKRAGRITDGPTQVLVIDRKAIERSGASDLKQLLVRYGLNR